MTSIDDLIAELRRTPPGSWERVYSASTVSVTWDSVVSHPELHGPFGEWFILRFDVGPPGVSLPDPNSAMRAVMACTGDGADAYCALFYVRLTPDAPHEISLALLSNAAACAASSGSHVLGRWVSLRAGIAAFALGDPKRAWNLLDLYNSGVSDERSSEVHTILEPIRGNTSLEESFWVRAVLHRLWPDLQVPAVPFLSVPEEDDGDRLPFDELLEELEATGANDLANLVRVLAENENSLHGGEIRKLRGEADQLQVQGNPEALVRLKHALELIAEDEVYWATAATELVAATLVFRDPEIAADQGLALLESALCPSGPELGMLHVVVGVACFRAGRSDEARLHLVSGLDYLRGETSQQTAVARLSLANLGIAENDWVLVREQLLALEHQLDALPIELRHDYHLIVAEFAEQQNSPTKFEEALITAIKLAPNHVASLMARARLVQARLRRGYEVEGLEEFVREATQVVESEYLSERLVDIICNHGVAWGNETALRLADWALRVGRPSVAAFLLSLGGRKREGLGFLNEALSEELSDAERLACLHQQLVLSEVEEFDQLFGPMEEALEALDVPSTRADLSAAMAQTAESELELRRAFHHAHRAFEVARDERVRRAAFRTASNLTLRLMRAKLPMSSPELADLVTWLNETERPERRPKMWAAIVHALLLPGPITHEECANTARKILSWGDIEAKDERELRARLKWIEKAGLEPRAEGHFSGPFDTLPRWMVDLVNGRKPSLDVETIPQELTHIRMALTARPDSADRILAALVRRHKEMAPSVRAELLAIIRFSVESASVFLEDWETLRREVRSLDSGQFGESIKRVLNRARHPNSPIAPLSLNHHGSSPDYPEAKRAFDEAVRLMQEHQLDPHSNARGDRILKVRKLLSRAVEVAERQALPELLDYVVSLGNAWKLEPDADVEFALECYAQAEALGGSDEQIAKLHKVKADALFQRGRDDDLRLASELLQDSARIRRGLYKAETLWSAAQVALKHPDLSELQRAAKAGEFLMESVRADSSHAEQWLQWTLRVLYSWLRLAPNDSRPSAFLDELKSYYPTRESEIGDPPPRLSEHEIASVAALLADPAYTAFMAVRAGITPVSELTRNDFGLLQHVGGVDSMKTALERESLLQRPSEAEALFRELVPSGDESAPGILAARVLLAAFLARQGRLDADEVRIETSNALDCINALAEPFVRVALLREIAVAWCPHNHADDPVADFALAVELLEQCAQLEGGEDTALTDTLGALARALRYSRVGDHLENVRRSRSIYASLLERSGLPRDMRANLSKNLAEADSYLGTGTQNTRLRDEEQRLESALRIAESARMKSEIASALGWNRTRQGMNLEGPNRLTVLQLARDAFEQVDRTLLNEPERRSFEGFRAVCETEFIRATEGADAATSFWRDRVSGADQGSYEEATAKHNLARAIVQQPSVSAESIAEALTLADEALEHRTIEANPRHCWETNLLVGQILTRLLRASRFDLLPVDPQEALEMCAIRLEDSCKAAESLGPGEELARSALSMFEIVPCFKSTNRMTACMDRNWSRLTRSAGYLLLDEQLREREAFTLAECAVALAPRLALQGLSVGASYLAFVLQGDKASLVGRWLGRAQEPTTRLLRARLEKPRGISAGRWAEWKEALDSRKEHRITHCLGQIHEVAPTFLGEGAPDETTWEWLEANAGSRAISMTISWPFSIALAMEVQSDGERKSWVLGFEGDQPIPGPFDADWVKANLIEPLDRFFGNPPSAVLWNPGPGLRHIPPSELWHGVPVSMTSTLSLPTRGETSRRPNSTLITMIDPGVTNDGFDELGDHGLQALASLIPAAESVGPVRVLAGQGGKYGRQVLAEGFQVRDTPASARDLIEELGEHKTAVVIAHGLVESPERAAIVCLDADGEIELLDVGMLEQHPDRLVGVTCILLSCETGRVGDSFSKPGGIAGTLIAAGAERVIAPLWPVELGVAAMVGEVVLKGIADGEDPAIVLARLQGTESPESPTLGPPVAREEREAKTAAQCRAFVTWVG